MTQSVKMRIGDNERAWLKARAMQRVATAALDKHRQFLLMEFIEAYLPLEEPHLSAFHKLLLTEDFREAAMLGKTSFELGMERGEARGEEKGRRLLVRDLLEAKFGPLPETALARLEALSSDKVRDLGRALLAPTCTLVSLGLTDP